MKTYLTSLLALVSAVACANAQIPYAEAVYPTAYPDGLGGEQYDISGSRSRSNPVGGYRVLRKLTNVTRIWTDAVQGAPARSGYKLANLRIRSNQTSLNDYLIGYYNFNFADQKLAPVKYEQARGVGIFEPVNRIFVKDNTAHFDFYTRTTTFKQGGQYVFQSGTEYYAKVTVGQKLCFVTSGIPAGTTYQLSVTLQDGTTFVNSSLKSTGSSPVIIWYDLPVLVSGIYKFKWTPVKSAAFNFSIRFYNQNASATTPVVSGDNLSASLAGGAYGYGLPYRKYRVVLKEGQTLTLGGDQDTTQYLLNSRGVIVGGGSNIGIIHKAKSSGTYYIVIEPYDTTNSSAESYNGRMVITN